MPYNDYEAARQAAWQTLLDCNIDSLPVDLGAICRAENYYLSSYTSGTNLISALGLSGQLVGSDGFATIHNGRYYIFYNDANTYQRQRFTVAHEIGHIKLGHIRPGHIHVTRTISASTDPLETQANQFAARLLQPACVLYGLQVSSENEIMELCNVSSEAAGFRAKRMQDLYQRRKFLSHPLERQVFNQFSKFIKRHRKSK